MEVTSEVLETTSRLTVCVLILANCRRRGIDPDQLHVCIQQAGMFFVIWINRSKNRA